MEEAGEGVERRCKVVHYINQFFGGIGGEERADEPPRVIEGPVGPGKRIQSLWSDRGTVVATLVCGDNYWESHSDEVIREWKDLLEYHHPDLVLAGPCFNAGRYGLACAKICGASASMGIPSVTGMYPENPGVEEIRKNLLIYIVETADRVIKTEEILGRMCKLGEKVAWGKTMGSSAEEGYLPRGFRRNVFHGKPGAMRALEMLRKKLHGSGYSTEIPLPRYDVIEPAPPIKNLKSATLALVTEGGLVPQGNPDRLESARATKWLRYPLSEKLCSPRVEYYSVHGGFDVKYINQDPCRILPLDALVSLQESNEFAALHGFYYVTTGNGTSISSSERYGREIARELGKAGVDGVILTAT